MEFRTSVKSKSMIVTYTCISETSKRIKSKVHILKLYIIYNKDKNMRRVDIYKISCSGSSVGSMQRRV